MASDKALPVAGSTVTGKTKTNIIDVLAVKTNAHVHNDGGQPLYDVGERANDSRQAGKYIITKLEQLGMVVESKFYDKTAQNEGYHFLMATPGCVPSKVRFKKDTNIGKTSNLAMEVLAYDQPKTAYEVGWGVDSTSEADYLLVFDASSEFVHLFDFPQLRRWWVRHPQKKWESIKTNTQNPKTGEYWTTLSVLIPIGEIITGGVTYSKIDLKPSPATQKTLF